MSKISRRTISDDTAFLLENISVSYQLASERTSSIKEYVIRWLQGKIKYTSFLALDNINLSVKEGEIFGILGRNGAGKSTLLKVLARVLYPTEGRVWVKGQVYPLLQLGAGFHRELTGIENVFLNGTLLGHSRKEVEEKLPEIIEFAEIGDFINAPLRTYSSGMIARLGFAVATAWVPDILILDETLSVGDAAFVEKCTNRMEEFRDSDATVLLVSHDADMINALCHRAALLEKGKLIIVGDAREVSEKYRKLISSDK
ncbi:ABC transporter ATP-binding protein [bacterium]|jgi:ABC-2 type transport system ATP-binding protein|nr:ABC transporter ATP-binding protein [Candidatus Scalindua sp.]MBT7088557.1 ABC transporter ATP-binding protein [bacterium]